MNSPFDRKLPKADNSPQVAAILLADIHLSQTPPVARSAEESWYEAMADPLRQVKDLVDKYQVPVICAGDVFDKWNSPPELINFALTQLPKMYAIPGQHDLPHHRYEDIRKSAFWTLVEAKKIINLEPEKPVEIGEGGKAIRLHGFPWGFPVEPLKESGGLVLKIAVVHAYIWSKATGYPGAPKEGYFRSVQKAALSYDLVVSGDNHIPFSTGFKKDMEFPLLYNCGGLMRRKSDERERPCYVGLLWTDGSVTTVELDCSEDKWIDGKDVPIVERGADMTEFLEELSSLGDATISFLEVIKHTMDKNGISQSVRDIILEAMEKL